MSSNRELTNIPQKLIVELSQSAGVPSQSFSPWLDRSVLLPPCHRARGQPVSRQHGQLLTELTWRHFTNVTNVTPGLYPVESHSAHYPEPGPGVTVPVFLS